MTALDGLKTELLAQVAEAKDLGQLEEARVGALGKKGRITGMMKDLGSLSPEERRERGQALNVVKDEVAAAVEARRQALQREETARRLEAERVDVTLPVRPETEGRVHPISQTVDEMVAIFAEMGFSVAEGPDIEDDFHNFTALNFPPGHPAREMHDTFYLPDAPVGTGPSGERTGGRMLLRTHTSPVQVRTMLSQKPPIRIVAPGRTYRSDYDMTHTPMFHQIEGLVIGDDIHMGHLKGCLIDFCRAFFGVDDLPLRFRPSFFPFTEPSAEVDIGCSRKGGELKLGDYGDWLEILGCGMVHPNVLEACGIDSTRYQGFAFGMGVERVAMLKYGIPDLRTFFEADLRWLKHYGFVPLDIPSVAQGLTR
jgi:phenylalanyl-tRNA synthetase alpha chain